MLVCLLIAVLPSSTICLLRCFFFFSFFAASTNKPRALPWTEAHVQDVMWSPVQTLEDTQVIGESIDPVSTAMKLC